MNELGNYLLPCMVLAIVAHGMICKVPVFDVFLGGALEGAHTAFKVLPTLVGLITAVAMLNASGIFEILANLLSPVAKGLGLPAQVIPLMLIHPVSGSGGMAVFTSLLERFGPDSHVGRVASVMCGSSETTLYSVTVYYGAVGVEKTRHTLLCGLAADFAAAVLSGIGVGLLL